MDSVLISGILTGSAAIIGSALASYLTTRANQKTQEQALKAENQRLQFEVHAKEEKIKRRYFEEAHILLNILEREFSLTAISINWASKLTPQQWDTKYSELCEKSDELRMIASYLGSKQSSIVEEMYGEMNIFWGNFREFLRRLEKGENVDWETVGYDRAHTASNKIGGLASRVKDELNSLYR